jgi:hypothetical protein
MHPTYRGLAFLVSMGSLPIACTGEKGDDGSSDGTGTPSTDPSSPAGTTTPDGGTESTTAGPTTAGPGSTPTDATATDATATDATATDATTGGNPVCEALAAHYVDCNPDYAMYAAEIIADCESYIAFGMMTDGPACADAFESFYACLSMLACDAPDGCDDAQIGAACPNLPGEDMTDTGDTSADTGTGG